MLAAFALFASYTGAAPLGKYVGEKRILGATIHVEITSKGSICDIELTGIKTISCPAEAFAFDGVKA